MAKLRENIVTAVDIGTNKICVLIGLSRSNGQLEVIGHGEVPTHGAVVKGDIINMELAFTQLSEAVEMADESAGNILANNCFCAVNVSGSNIEVFESTGSVMIQNLEQRVTENEYLIARDNASNYNIAIDKSKICAIESYSLIDGVKKLSHPVNQSGRILEVHMQIFCGNTNNVNNFRNLLLDVGIIENNIETIFSGIATCNAVVSENESENGVLVVDFGAGTTEYVVIQNTGVLAAGVIQVGFEHLLNDLSLGLQLPIKYLREIAVDGTLEDVLTMNKTSLEYRLERQVKKINLSSIETIVDARLQELFDIIKQEISKSVKISDLTGGGVLTGGGALLTRSQEVFRDSFKFNTRVARPQNINGNSSILSSPQYSTAYGLLKCADSYLKDIGYSNVGKVGNVVDNIWGNLKELAGAIKI